MVKYHDQRLCRIDFDALSRNSRNISTSMSRTRPICLQPRFLAPMAMGLIMGAMACAKIQAQGYLQFENSSTTIPITHRAPVFGVDACSCAKNGNTSSGIPTGVQTYTGALLAGSGFTIELWAAPSDAPDSALAPVARTTFRTSPQAGIFFPMNVAAPVAMPGASLKCQARAWNNASGTLTSWNQALCAGAQAGSSAIFSAGPIPLSGSAMTTNLRSFCLVQQEGGMQSLFLSITRNGNTTTLDSFNPNHLITGDDVQINATGPGTQSPTLRLQWRRNGLDLPGGTNSTLDLTLVETSQSGPYSLLATDSGCSREMTFELQVHPPPSLRQPRVDIQGRFLVTVVAAPFRAVTVENSTNLASWSTAGTGTADATGNFEFSHTFPASPTGSFLRAKVGP